MSQRFLDLKHIIPKQRDFIRRKHGLTLNWLLASHTVIGIAVVLLLLYTPQTFMPSVAMGFMIIYFGMVGLTYYIVTQYRDVIDAVEFQNALFAGAAKMHSEFCAIVRHDGTIAYSDSSFDSFFGKGGKQKIRRLAATLKKPVLPKEVRNQVLTAIDEGRSERIEFTFTDDNKRKKIVALTIEPLGIYAQRPGEQTLTLAVEPITRPSGYFVLKAERNMQITKEVERLSKFHIGAYVLNQDNEFIFVNDVFAKTIGYKPKELTQKPMHFNDILWSTKEAQKLCNRKRSWRKDVGLKDAEGEIVHTYVAQDLAKGPDGKVLEKHGVVVSYPSEDKSANPDSLVDKRILRLLDNSPIATAILDEAGTVIRCNSIFRDIAELPKSKKLRWKLPEIMSEDDRDDINELLDNIAKGNITNPKPLDVTLSRSKDTAATLYVNGIINNFGECEGIVAHLMDTTEMKNLELRFVHSQKMQAVGQLAGGIAHDFNNLLTAMMGFCDLLLLRHPAGDQSFAEIMQIKQNANRAANLVRQLLAFSRKQTLQPEILNITDVLADLSNLIGRLIGEGTELDIVHGRDIGLVRVDQGQFEQVMINLAVNARDAMPQGGKLTIKTSNITIDSKFKLDRSYMAPGEDDTIEKGDYVLIEVIDNGCGIEKEKMNKIFEPFFTTKEVGSGTGLGLSTVYGIIKQTDGYIYISSTLKKGTKFSIFLKRQQGVNANTKPVARPAPRALAEREKKPITDLTGNGTILLVEDEDPVRIFSSSALSKKGYNVIEADSAEAALAIIDTKGSEIDIIISDVIMPGMNGPKMVEKITKKFPDIRVIFISGYAEDAFVKMYGSERSFNFLSKPYTLKQLAGKVKEVLAT